MQRLQAFPPSIRAFLGEFVVRRRRLAVLRAAGWAAYAFVLWLLVACAGDRLLHFTPAARLIVLSVGCGGTLAILLWPLRRLWEPVNWVYVAESIEAHNPAFRQRLITVTSQLLGDPANRGSDQILAQLLDEVDRQAARQRHHLPMQPTIRPWILCATAVAGVAALWRVPTLAMPQLVDRFTHPLAPVPPVTTTQITVAPGDCDVAVSQPLRIDVVAQRLVGDTVWLHLNDDGAHWSRSAMESAGEARYSTSLAAVDRDMSYFVAAGDAISPQYQVRVKRAPVISEFRLRYIYPPYMGRSPFTVSNTGGQIEAPIGSEVEVSIVTNEPLASAVAIIGNERIPFESTLRENVRRARLAVKKDDAYHIELVSARGVRGEGPVKLHIHATADRPPIVRFQQANQALRLNPRDVVPLSYQALDDYGLDSLIIRAHVNGDRTIDIPIALSGDHRHQDQALNLDLASLRASVGDSVAVTLVARDSDGQLTSSDPLQILISGHSVDLEARARVHELADAAQFAQMLGGEWDAAAKAWDESATAPDGADSPAAGRANRRLSGAAELASLLRQSLLRATVHSTAAQLSLALANWMDLAQQQATTAEELFREGGSLEEPASVPPQMRAASVACHRLAKELQVAAQGERASIILGDIQSLRAMQAGPSANRSESADRRASIVRQTQGDIRTAAADAGLNADAPDLEVKLQQSADAERALLREARLVDFAAAARVWGDQLRRFRTDSSGFEERLLAAFQAEAVRPDADAQRSWDLELAARATAALELAFGGVASVKDAESRKLSAIIEAISQLQHDYDMSVAAAGPSTAPSPSASHAAAEEARRTLAQIAGDPARPVAAAPGGRRAARNVQAESLAIRASVESAARNYQNVTELDAALAHTLIDAARSLGSTGLRPRVAGESPTTDPSVAARVEGRVEKIERAHQSIARNMSAAEAADRLEHNQQQLRADIASADPSRAAELARQQRSMADAIDQVAREQEALLTASTQPAEDDPEWRGKGTAALLAAQQELSALPQALSAVQSAVDAKRDADRRAAAAAQAAQVAGADQKAAADRAADQAAADAADAAERVRRTIASALSHSPAELAQSLAPFSPEASEAADVLTELLGPALAALEKSAATADAAGVDQSAADVRLAIDAAQDGLARAQEAFMQRDPLFAAKWYARAAAESLAHSPGDLKTVLGQQANVQRALSRAWDRSVHRAAAQRLAMLPSLQAVYAPAPAGADHPTTAPTTMASGFSSSRQWGQLRPHPDDEVTSSLAAPDPPGYEEDLRLYFQVLGKLQPREK